MRKLLIALLAAALPLSATAAHHEGVAAEIRAMEQTFNDAYATNDLDTYFGMYTEDATLIFFGARQPVADYEAEWHAMVDAGGAVEKNEMSDVRVQVMPGGDVAIATYILETDTRAPDGSMSTARAYETDVWQKIDGAWKIVSMHYSEIPPAE